MAGAAPAHGSPQLFARALTARRGDLAAWRYVEAARRQRPDDPFWTVHAAAIRLGAGDTTFADTALGRFVPRSADAALLAGLVAAKRGQAERARGLLARALVGGADSAETRAALATLPVGRCDVAVKEFLLLLDFGIERDDGPDLVIRCRRGLKL